MTKEEIKELVENNKVVLFMKGEPAAPACGFSQKAVRILAACQVDFVLADDDLRQYIKEFSDWPTIPQLYINGEFMGGSDIMLDMYKDNTLMEALNAED
jgi:monothiol glutaredoxin